MDPGWQAGATSSVNKYPAASRKDIDQVQCGWRGQAPVTCGLSMRLQVILGTHIDPASLDTEHDIDRSR
jgi:hypothetical protein